MKKSIICLIIVLLFINCATPVKGVFNPNDIPEDELILLEISPAIILHEVNNSKLKPLLRSPFGSYIIKVPSGNNVFTVSFSSSNLYSLSTGKVSGIFERDNQYYLTSEVDFNNKTKTRSVSYHIYKYNDRKQGEEVTITNPLQISNSTCSNKYICEYMAITAFPQLLAGKKLTQEEFKTMTLIAVHEYFGYIDSNGKILDRDKLVNLVFKTLGRNELYLHFGSNPPQDAKLAGYILEISNNNEIHFAIAGTDKKPLYSYCNAKGSVVSTQEVYIYAD